MAIFQNNGLKENRFVGKGDFVYRLLPSLVIQKAEGIYLYDIDGQKLLSADASNGTAGLGYDLDLFKEVMSRAKSLIICPSYLETPVRLEVAKRLCADFKRATGLEGQVAFELGGAQAIELSYKVVWANNPKSLVFVFEGSHHGRIGVTTNLSSSLRYRKTQGYAVSLPVVRLPSPDPMDGDLDQYLKQCLARVKRLLSEELGGAAMHSSSQDIAALYLEPFQNAGGMVRPDPVYINEVVRLLREAGALIAVDEVFMGFHRTGPMWSFEHYNFVPDIVVFGKALTNGMVPLSGVWAREPLMDEQHFPPGTHSATYAVTPLGLYAACVVLERYTAWSSIEEDVRQIEARLRAMLADLHARYSEHIKSWDAFGAAARLVLREASASQVLSIARAVGWQEPVQGVHGLLLASTRLRPDVVGISPPLTITAEECQILRELLERTFSTLKQQRR